MITKTWLSLYLPFENSIINWEQNYCWVGHWILNSNSTEYWTQIQHYGLVTPSFVTTETHSMRQVVKLVSVPFLYIYKGNSKINFRLVGKKKRAVIEPKHMLSSDKQRLLLLNAYPHTFSLRSVGVITAETRTLSSPLPPAVRYVFWGCKGIFWQN